MTDLRGLAGPMGPGKHMAKVGHLLQGFPGSQGQASPNKSAFPGPGAGAAGVASPDLRDVGQGLARTRRELFFLVSE